MPFAKLDAVNRAAGKRPKRRGPTKGVRRSSSTAPTPAAPERASTPDPGRPVAEVRAPTILGGRPVAEVRAPTILGGRPVADPAAAQQRILLMAAALERMGRR